MAHDMVSIENNTMVFSNYMSVFPGEMPADHQQLLESRR